VPPATLNGRTARGSTPSSTATDLGGGGRTAGVCVG